MFVKLVVIIVVYCELQLHLAFLCVCPCSFVWINSDKMRFVEFDSVCCMYSLGIDGGDNGRRRGCWWLCGGWGPTQAPFDSFFSSVCPSVFAFLSNLSRETSGFFRKKIWPKSTCARAFGMDEDYGGSGCKSQKKRNFDGGLFHVTSKIN